MTRDNSRSGAICNLKTETDFVNLAIFVMDDWKHKYDELLKQFNDLQVAFDEKCDQLEMLQASAGNNVRLTLFRLFFLRFTALIIAVNNRGIRSLYFLVSRRNAALRWANQPRQHSLSPSLPHRASGRGCNRDGKTYYETK